MEEFKKDLGNDIDPETGNFITPNNEHVEEKLGFDLENRFSSDQSFHQFLQRRVVKKEYQRDFIDKVKEKFEANSCTELFDPENLPGNVDQIDSIGPDDWKYIHNAKDRLLALYSVLNFYFREKVNQSEREIFRGSDVNTYLTDYEDRSRLTVEETGNLYTLPLVYSTNRETLVKILQSGKIVPDREFTRIMLEQGSAPVDISSNSFVEDRKAGLDNYVFSYFGRPNSSRHYGDVQILIKPDRLLADQNSFVTRNDFLDEEIVLDQEGEDKYKDQVLQGEYFLKASGREIKRQHSYKNLETQVSSDFINGRVDSIDWEVKTGSIDASEIDKIVFTKLEDLRSFRESYGQTIPIVYNPDKSDLGAHLRELYPESAPEIEAILSSQLKGSELQDNIARNFPDFHQDFFSRYGIPILKPDQIYATTDFENRKASVMRECLEEGSEERIRALEQPETKRATFYLRVLGEASTISEKSNIYLLCPQQVFTTKEDAIDYFNRQRQHQKERARRQAASGFGSDFVSSPMQPQKEETVTLLEVETLSEEWDQYENAPRHGKPLDVLKHYRITETDLI